MARELAVPPESITSIVYCGTPDIAVPPLRALHEAGVKIEVVVTGEDKRRGRGSKTSPSPVKRAALELGLEVSTVPADIATSGANLGVVVAYGQIISTSVLEQLPMVNLHFSLLPRWRGAAPVERAILAGDSETGVCVMAVAPKLDTGDIYQQTVVAIDDDHTLEGLRSDLVRVGSEMLVDGVQTGFGEPTPQAGPASYAKKIDPAEHQIDFSRPAIDLHRLVRLGSAWTTFRDKRLKVLETEAIAASDLPGSQRLASVGEYSDGVFSTGDGWLRLITVQPAGKRAMEATAWLNGVQPKPGERFG